MHPRQAIREAVKAQLVGTAPSYRTLAADRVFETRVIPLQRTQLPAVMVYTLKEPIDPASRKTSPRRLKRELELMIEGVVEAGDNVDDAMDALAAQIECAMNFDARLGLALVDDSLLSDTEMEVGTEGQKLIGLVRLTYAVTYYTHAPDADCAPTLAEFEQANVEWSLRNAQPNPNDRTKDEIDLEE